jgi:hypothetical protein
LEGKAIIEKGKEKKQREGKETEERKEVES